MCPRVPLFTTSTIYIFICNMYILQEMDQSMTNVTAFYILHFTAPLICAYFGSLNNGLSTNVKSGVKLFICILIFYLPIIYMLFTRFIFPIFIPSLIGVFYIFSTKNKYQFFIMMVNGKNQWRRRSGDFSHSIIYKLAYININLK